MADSFLLEKWQEHIQNIDQPEESPAVATFPNDEIAQEDGQEDVTMRVVAEEQKENVQVFDESMLAVANLAEFTDTQAYQLKL